MVRTVPVLACLLLAATCTRPCVPCGSHQAARNPTGPQHLLVRATRMQDASAERPQVLIEAAVLAGLPATTRLNGAQTEGAFESSVSELLIDDVRVLQLPSVVTADGEEAVIEVADEDEAGTAMRFRAVPIIKGDRVALELDYSQVNPTCTARAELDLPDRGTVLVPAE